MGIIEALAENRILAAQDEGLFRNLPGEGKSLNLDDDSSIPEDLRLTFKILKNAGCLPAELELHKQIHNLRELLHTAVDESARTVLRRELNFIQMKKATSGERLPPYRSCPPHTEIKP